MQIGSSPNVSSSRKRIVYKPSTWRIHQFEIWSGDLLCKAVALRVQGALLLWLGGAGAAQLSEIALGMPAPSNDGNRDALSTTLIGADGTAAAMARRLSAALERPVYVCSGVTFDRFTMPLIERGLVAEIKSRPECF
ncbi:unnamed protein product [Arctia plantaginis]|uniref:Uncharacterized protein n=1 Tax=Arctia plantaginis TaxID=874455 RepID=A0A8S1B043_ARCPL|nr:unnamed protein product [Arctia plantaginis]CAB3250979.1 unnamed protein product [Arctia plantaginis]